MSCGTLRREEDPPIDFARPSIAPDWRTDTEARSKARRHAQKVHHARQRAQHILYGRPVPAHSITEAKIESDWGPGDIVRDFAKEHGKDPSLSLLSCPMTRCGSACSKKFHCNMQVTGS